MPAAEYSRVIQYWYNRIHAYVDLSTQTQARSAQIH